MSMCRQAVTLCRWQLLHKLKGGHTGTSTKESKLFGVMTTVSPGNPVGRLDGAVVQKDSAGQIVKASSLINHQLGACIAAAIQAPKYSVVS